MGIHVDVWGTGPRVVLVHGSLTTGRKTWRQQRALAERWTLVVPSRRGFVPNPPEAGSDFDVDAGDIAELLDEGAHLVGHSYGGLVALLAAARRPDAVHSLCLFEPAAPSLLHDDAMTRTRIKAHEKRRAMEDPREFLLSITTVIGGPPSVPDPLPPDVEQHVRLAMGERPSYEATIPVDELAALPVPKLVISAGTDPRQERMSETVAAALRAEHTHCPGAGHQVPRAPGVNDVLERFWRSRERSEIS